MAPETESPPELVDDVNDANDADDADVANVGDDEDGLHSRPARMKRPAERVPPGSLICSSLNPPLTDLR